MKRARYLVLLGAVATAQPAAALGTATWNQICSQAGLGIATFATCASATVNVAANGMVTINYWNLAGLNGTFADAIMTAIGLENMPGITDIRNLTVFRVDGSTFSGWTIAGGGGGIPGPSIALGATTSGIGGGVASEFHSGTPVQEQTDFSSGFGSGFVQFNFQTGSCTGSGTNQVCVWGIDFDPNVTRLGLHVQGGPNGQSTGYSCAPTGVQDALCLPPTVIPEPMTLTLMATGLVGLAGAGFMRRRRNN